MNKLTICEDALHPESWVTVDFEGDVREEIKRRFEAWPKTAKVYHKYVANSADVTPYDAATVERLGKLTGHFYVLILPETFTVFLIISLIVGAAAIGLSFLLRPHITPNVKNQQNSSPNNELTDRQNKERPNERIPDIFGKLWSTPDLIQVPYRYFNGGGIETEISYMCIGRGSYTIEQIRDDLTPIASIAGSCVEVYGPYTSPNSGDAPQLRVGTAIATPVKSIKRMSGVNGQTLIAPNLPGGGLFIGPFVLGDNTVTELLFNFVAEAGAYQVDGTTGAQTAVTVTIQVGITPCDANGTATGAEVLHNINLTGSASIKDRVGVTLDQTGLAAGFYSIRAKRTSNTSIAANISVSDEVKWRDAFAVAPVAATDFGNVTTVQTLTLPTPDALALQERKLNLLVTRNVPIGTLASGVVTFAPAGPSKSAADILCAIALDSHIGNRTLTELDLPGIYQAVTDVATYFGTSLCSQFCFTFDDAKVSFEESVRDIATAVFCTAFRRGSVISLQLEKLTANSTLLFNHRNKLPGSETRTVSFGKQDDLDGIELTYTEPNDPNSRNQDVPTTLYFPADQSAVNPKRITAVGVRNNVQAYMMGWRLFNKLVNQNTVTEFQATAEAATCVLNDRVLVADNTRQSTQDGEVLAVDSLLLTLSQPVTFVGGRTYTIFLQLPNGTIESKVITAGAIPSQVVLASPPSVPLVVDDDRYAKSTYMIVDDTPQRAFAFLIQEKTAQDSHTFDLKCVNYDDAYYAKDQDFALSIVTSNGDEGTGTGTGTGVGGTYHPTVYNDIGDTPAGIVTNTTVDMTGTWTRSHHIDPDTGFLVIDDDIENAEVIWSGFPSIFLTGASNLHVVVTTATLTGVGSSITINGLAISAPGTYTFAIPSGTYLSTINVDVLCQGGNAGGTSGFKSARVVISDIYIS